jgi:hypothetical protein
MKLNTDELDTDELGKMTDKELMARINVFSDTEELVDLLAQNRDYASAEMTVHALGLWDLVQRLGKRLKELSPEDKSNGR